MFEIDSDNAYTSGDSYKKGSTFTVNLSRKLPLYKDRIIYRMKNGSVTKEIAEKYASQRRSKEASKYAFYGRMWQADEA